ncbi:MAG TPA: hypothetical protein VEU74_11930 [Gemmatimonadales bacterium]|nr:hypothetical protein [Gemmatimonadales bacterium]
MLEREVKKDVINLYEALGCFVYSTISRRTGPTPNTPGLPDLWVMHPRGFAWWHELKGDDGEHRPAQALFQRRCQLARIGYVLGGLDAARLYVRHIGLTV